ncbi:hypothetical protein [Rickettsia endosymbiont of Nabis limbatus]|uniref:hypothetical protein n=1 Tax=Rickettsia endosymbiont of Nabis limbatus TaxID=3066268 RepID=UPI003AF358DE
MRGFSPKFGTIKKVIYSADLLHKNGVETKNLLVNLKNTLELISTDLENTNHLNDNQINVLPTEEINIDIKDNIPTSNQEPEIVELSGANYDAS